MAAHPFYADLIYIQHQVPMVCPWAVPSVRPTDRSPQAEATGCPQPPGVVPLDASKLSPTQLAEARLDAQRLHIGWAVVWKRNISVAGFVLPYLKGTGFKYAYRDGNVLVYRRR
jgi:hypothetical protein